MEGGTVYAQPTPLDPRQTSPWVEFELLTNEWLQRAIRGRRPPFHRVPPTPDAAAAGPFAARPDCGRQPPSVVMRRVSRGERCGPPNGVIELAPQPPGSPLRLGARIGTLACARRARRGETRPQPQDRRVDLPELPV